MAMIKCPECGKEVSDKSLLCIHCGCPIKKDDQDNKKSLESHVIAYRSSPGSVVTIYIVGLILSLIIIIAYVILGIAFGEPVWLGMVFFALIAVFLLVMCTFGVIRVGANAANKSHCIRYDATNCKFVLCTVWGKEIIIDPSDYVELKDNFFTDNMLIFTYRLPSGRLKKVNLGPCLDRDRLRARISNVIDNLEK